MSHLAHAYLAYGVDLDNGDCIPVPDDFMPGNPDRVHCYALEKLYNSTPSECRGCRDKETAVVQELGIKFLWHGSETCSYLAMAVEVFHATHGEVVSICPNSMIVAGSMGRYESRIRDAIATIGIDPDHGLCPTWMLLAERE